MSCQKHHFPLIGPCNVCGKDDHPEVTKAHFDADEKRRARSKLVDDDLTQSRKRTDGLVRAARDIVGLFNIEYCRKKNPHQPIIALAEALARFESDGVQ